MDPVEVDAPAAAVCWKCNGDGAGKGKGKGARRVACACAPCGGTGQIHRAARVAQRKEKLFAGWPVRGVGPTPAAAAAAAAASLPGPPAPLPLQPHEEWCYFSGAWRLLQKTNAHRYSTDDVVTAWVGWRAGRALRLPFDTCMAGAGAGFICDIGCGLGSVLLMNAWLHPNAGTCIRVHRCVCLSCASLRPHPSVLPLPSPLVLPLLLLLLPPLLLPPLLLPPLLLPPLPSAQRCRPLPLSVSLQQRWWGWRRRLPDFNSPCDPSHTTLGKRRRQRLRQRQRWAGSWWQRCRET